jgi:hypothetical protein
VLADLDARHVGRHRPELAAVLERRIGLQVPGILVCRAAPHEEQDAGLRPAEALSVPETVPAERGPGPEDLRQRQAEEADAPGTQELPAVHPPRRAEPSAAGAGHERPRLLARMALHSNRDRPGFPLKLRRVTLPR